MLAGQGAAPSKEQADDAAGFKEFSARVQAYVKLQKTVESESSRPEAHGPAGDDHGASTGPGEEDPGGEAAREARATSSRRTAREAFRHASRAALEGPRSADSRAYMEPGAPNPSMRLAVNGIYPDTEPITALSPAAAGGVPAAAGRGRLPRSWAGR